MNESPRLPPFPKGWFAVATSAELPKSGVVPTTFMGQPIVLFRTEKGAPAAVDAYCPHMGAHLGYGGTVVGETLRCPFHGFRFDASGGCAATGYGTKPPAAARVRALPVRERHGVVLAYHDPQGNPPSWETPELETSGWSQLLSHRFSLRGHPQETSENSVDIGHLSAVHGYRSVEALGGIDIDGPRLHGRYRMTRFIRVAGRFGLAANATFDIHLHGLGYSLVDVRIPDRGIHMRQFVFATPTDPGQIDLRIAISVEHVERPRRVSLLAAPVPGEVLARVISRAVLHLYIHDVGQDLSIWQNKRYVHSPALAAGDGPVMAYRKWASQFYVPPAASALATLRRGAADVMPAPHACEGAASSANGDGVTEGS